MKSKLLALGFALATVGGVSLASAGGDRPPLDAATQKAFETCKALRPAKGLDKTARHEQREAFKKCVVDNGGTPPKWHRHRRHKTLDEKTQKAVEACKDKKPAKVDGVRPTPEQFAAFRECVTAQGGQLPERGRHLRESGAR